MARLWKTVRIFISSTFRDMHAERDFLVHDVFLELNERCAKRRLHLIDVDLRWGVTEEEERQGKVIEICLDEIERCRPFFIGLLGERYGWTPPRYEVPDDEKYEWVRELETRESGHSVTALEIYHGVLRNPSMQTRAFFYFRDPSFLQDPRFLEEVPAAKQRDFLPESEDAARKLKALKDEIKEHYPVFENYPCQYGGLDEKGQVKLDLEPLRNRILEELWEAIKLEHPEDATPRDEVAIERSYHEAFIEGRSQRFIGRRDVLAQLAAFADGQAETTLVVTGKAGCGKSAVLANFVKDYAAKHPDEFVLAHFIGVSPGSTDIRRTLLRLCRALARQFEIQDEIPTDYYELRQTFVKFLEQSVTKGKVLLVIDALNQLDESHYAHALDWLPRLLPGGLKAIASTTDESDCIEALRGRSPAPREVVVGALTEEERKEIVRQMLEVYRKHLDERPENDQMGLLLSKSESDNPLYLTVACEELRVFGEFERVTKRIEALPGEVESLFEQVLERIEDDHERVEPNKGKERVKTALSLLECSRHGLLESEILELLAPSGEKRLPQSTWARFYRSLKFYLRPSGESGEGVLDFFHRQLSKAARQRYLKNEGAEVGAHQRLAKYFRREADPKEDGSWTGTYPRALSDLAFHLHKAERHGDLFIVARDETFLRAQTDAFPFDPALQLEAPRLAITAAACIDNAARMAEFAMVCARRMASIEGQSPLDALREGNSERALGLADLRDSEYRALWYLLLAWEMNELDRGDEAHLTLKRLLTGRIPRLSMWKSEYASELLYHAVEISEEAFPALHRGLLDDDGHRSLCNYLSASGLFGPALEAAMAIQDHWARTVALSAVATEQARTGDLAGSRKIVAAAFQTSQLIEVLEARMAALRDIAVAQALAGEYGLARQTVETIEGDWDQIGALAGIAAAQVTVGQNETANECLALAFKIVEAANGNSSFILDERKGANVKTMAAIATAQTQAGNSHAARVSFSAALHAVNAMESRWSQAWTFSTIAMYQTQVGQGEAARLTLNRALQAVQGIQDGRQKVDALRAVANAQKECGDPEASRLTLIDALCIARSIQHLWHRWDLLVPLAGELAQAGEFDTALEVVQEIGHAWEQTSALKSVAVAQARANQCAAALQTAQLIESEEERAEALREIAVAQAQQEDGEAGLTTMVAAVQLAGTIHSEEKRANALKEIARVQIRWRKCAAARATLVVALQPGRAVDNETWRDDALREVVAAQAEAADFVSAIQTVAAIRSVEKRADGLKVIAVAQAQGGEFEVARLTFASAVLAVEEIKYGSGRAEALRAIALAQAEVGESDAATQTAESIHQSWQRAREMGELVSVQDRQYAEKAVAEVRLALLEFSAAHRSAQPMADASEGNKPSRAVSGLPSGAMDYFSATEAARLIHDDKARAEALCDSARRQIETGEVEAAQAVLIMAVEAARGISNERDQVDVLAAIAVLQAQAGDHEGAHSTLVACLHLAKATEATHPQGEMGKAIASAQAQIGDHDSAMQTALAITDNWRRVGALVQIAEVHVGAGRREEALGTLCAAHQTVSLFSDRWEQTRALEAIALEQSRAGETTVAIQTLAEIPDIAERDESLKKISAFLAATKDFAAALQTAQVIEDWGKWAAAWGTILEAQLQAHDFNGALHTAQTMNDGNRQARALKAIAASQAQVRDFAAGLKTAALIEDENENAEALALIGTAQAVAGFCEQAVQTAELIVTGRNRLLPQIAEHLVQTGDRQSVKRLLIPIAQYVDSTYRMCGLLARMYPEEATAIAQIVRCEE